MAMLGPMVVVAETAATELVDCLSRAGAFPVVEARLAEAAAALREIQPVALVLAGPLPGAAERPLKALVRTIETRGGPFMPVLARIEGLGTVAIPNALIVPTSEPLERFVACLNSALRIRSQHAAVIRRSRSLEPARNWAVPFADLIDQATVICIGRGRHYPALTTAVGERVGVIGAMSVETAARYLHARELDGIVIGDGFSPRVVEALLAVISEDVRFRDLPVGLLGRTPVDDQRLANLVRVESDAKLLAERLIPFVRLQVFASWLKRLLKSLDADGTLDPQTGLLDHSAFWQDLERAVQQAEADGGALTIARFAFEELSDPRCSVDAARLFARLMRNADFACREQDGSIIAAFTETDLRNAHVVARRIASVLRHTMISPEPDRRAIRPTVTLATLKSSDNLSTLAARIGTYPKLAAG
ncbi:MAG: GGDEF domain-containing protein [Gammaproteobacteria bacterium]|nr:GGDEF domain-containing protein [Gammaproteobacteria bacterium]